MHTMAKMKNQKKDASFWSGHMIVRLSRGAHIGCGTMASQGAKESRRVHLSGRGICRRDCGWEADVVDDTAAVAIEVQHRIGSWGSLRSAPMHPSIRYDFEFMPSGTTLRLKWGAKRRLQIDCYIGSAAGGPPLCTHMLLRQVRP